MAAHFWFLLIGGLFVIVALGTTLLGRLPLSTAMIYLSVGYALGPHGFAVVSPDLGRQSTLLERLTEVAVLVSLFVAGLKLRQPLSDRRWWLAIRLAGPVMLLTIAMVAALGVWGFGLSLGAAVLLGAVLAPTDPVLAADVSVNDPADRDRLRFALTGEAGLNDGTAFPFVVLGLGLLGLHELGSGGWKWVAVDLLWATTGGLALGWFVAKLIGRLILYLRQRHKESVGLDDFLSLGLIAMVYGAALLTHTYGFLAVFAAGVSLRRIESKAGGEDSHPTEGIEAAVAAGGPHEAATHAEKAPAYMAAAVLGFNEQLERVAELFVVIVIGVLLSSMDVHWTQVGFAVALLFVVRPTAVLLGLWRAPTVPTQRELIAWFGIRGVGSVYYLTYALNHGIGGDIGRQLSGLVIVTVAASVLLHGVTVTPLMNHYYKR